jgi:Emfourin
MYTPMKLHFERSGGFAGLRQIHDIGPADLTPEDTAELNSLVESSHFFDLPSQLHATNPGADRFHYKLALDTGNRQHTVELDDAAVPQNVRPLINWIAAKSRTPAPKSST